MQHPPLNQKAFQNTNLLNNQHSGNNKFSQQKTTPKTNYKKTDY